MKHRALSEKYLQELSQFPLFDELQQREHHLKLRSVERQAIHYRIFHVVHHGYDIQSADQRNIQPVCTVEYLRPKYKDDFQRYLK